MSRIFIYYSDTGNGDAVASCLKEKGFDIRKAVPVKPLPKAFFLKILNGGFLAGIGSKAPLNGYDPDVSAYDEVYIGSPIWNGQLTCPINTVLEKTDLSGKKTGFILWSGSGSAPKAEGKLKEISPDAPLFHLVSPSKNPQELEKLADL